MTIFWTNLINFHATYNHDSETCTVKMYDCSNKDLRPEDYPYIGSLEVSEYGALNYTFVDGINQNDYILDILTKLPAIQNEVKCNSDFYQKQQV